MKNIFIIGAHGYKANYGGWETFVTSLIDNYNDKNTNFHISEVLEYKKENYKINDNITIYPICVKKIGSARMLVYSIKAFCKCLKYIQQNKLRNTYIYILGLKLGPFLMFKKKKVGTLDAKIIVNPDGLEHERSKWSYPVKKFFLLSEKWMLNNCDIIICDAKGIKEYIDIKYPKLQNKTNFIAYGAKQIDISKINQGKILEKYNLEKDKYCLMVGRCVPENNYELVINEFMKSKINKKLIIVSNISDCKYYKELIKKTKCLNDSRIKFINGIYDDIKLTVIRKNAFLYIHGHSVGGTNPSLLEALNTTKINVLYNINFNKDVGGNACLYFDYENRLYKILDNIEQIDSNKLGNLAKEIIKYNYTWEIIVNKYKKIFI